MSMFERLINNDIEKVTLEYQRRMRPEFSEFIRLIYPDYKDCENVKHYENIRGVE